MTIFRNFLAEAYTPGEILEVQIRLEYDGALEVTAAGVLETLPVGWTYVGPGSGDVPDIDAPSGNSVEFAWITAPAFPAQFTYRVRASAEATGLKSFSGYAIYRTTGDQLQSNTVVSDIDQAPDPDPVTVSFTPVSDTMLVESGQSAQRGNGGGEYFFIGTTYVNSERRALMRFDLSSIPTGATITDVSLALELSRRPQAPGQTITVHRLLDTWSEGTNVAGGNEGQGGPAQAGDATWYAREYPGTLWGALGGDFDAAPSAATVVDQLGPYEWTDLEMVVDVQDWVDTPTDNHGWILLGGEALGSARRFNARENPDTATRPTLTVTYLP